MAHSKVYGFCDAKCKVEVVPKKGGTFDGEIIANGGLRSNFVRKLQADGQNVAFVLFEETDTSNIASLNARKSTGTNTAIYPALKLFANSDGTYYATLHSNYIGWNDGSDKIVTIAMANKLPSLVHRYDNEVIDGIKTFTSSPIIQTTGVEAQVSSIRLTDASSIKGYTVAGRMGFHWKDWKFNGALTSWRDANFSCTEITAGCDTKNSTIGVMQPLNGNDGYGVAPPTPSGANGNEIATAGWVNNKNKVTNVTSYDQLMDLIKNGKRGDSFGITMDYTGSSLGGITTSEAVETHAFGYYTIDEIEVADGVLNSFQAFGSGEVSGKFKGDNTSYIYATTGFGRAVVFNSSGDAFRVVNEGSLTYFLTSGVTISAFDGYYISI